MIVVTGLPRSGTTMMMHMLKSAGVETYGHPKTMETENSVLLPGETEWLSEVKGAVKILSPHKHYPPRGNYKFIWMKRDIDQQAKSMRKYVEQLLGHKIQKGWKSRYRKNIVLQTNLGLSQLQKLGTIHVQRFEDVLDGNIDALADFLGLDKELMLKPVRERSKRCAKDFLEKEYYYKKEQGLQETTN